MVHRPDDKMVVFRQHPYGLYYHDTASRNTNDNASKITDAYKQSVAFITTVAGNMKIFTRQKIDRAKEARRACGLVDTPSPSNFKHMVCGQSIKNFPVTNEDMFVPQNMYGTDVTSLEAKTTRTTTVLKKVKK